MIGAGSRESGAGQFRCSLSPDSRLPTPMLFRNILFPTDFTPHARSALKYAAAFARQGHGRVVLFSVQPASVPANLMTLPRRVLQDQDSTWLLQLRAQVEDLLTDPLFNGLEVEPAIVEGEPAP